jgi:hypothetical protein
VSSKLLLAFPAAVALALAVAVACPPARAQERGELLTTSHKSFASPQNFALEFRVAPSFTPDVDSDPALGGATPYADAFGSDSRVMVGVELDWQALRIPHFGSLGPGLGVGYTAMSAKAPYTVPHNGITISGEDTSLNVYPFYGVAVLRIDVLSHEVGIPLVPFAKAGLGYSLWRASNTLGTSCYEGVCGKGHSMGSQLALGLALSLNPFDEYAAKNFDDAMGVNYTYLFAELTRADLTSPSGALRVGGTSWTFGLALEF